MSCVISVQFRIGGWWASPNYLDDHCFDLFPYGVQASIMIGSVDHDYVKWKYFPRYWPFVRGIHRSPLTSPHKGQWRGALMFSSICAWINGWVSNREAGELRRHYAIHVVTEIWWGASSVSWTNYYLLTVRIEVMQIEEIKKRII